MSSETFSQWDSCLRQLVVNGLLKSKLALQVVLNAAQAMDLTLPDNFCFGDAIFLGQICFLRERFLFFQ